MTWYNSSFRKETFSFQWYKQVMQAEINNHDFIEVAQLLNWAQTLDLLEILQVKLNQVKRYEKQVFGDRGKPEYQRKTTWCMEENWSYSSQRLSSERNMRHRGARRVHSQLRQYCFTLQLNNQSQHVY